MKENTIGAVAAAQCTGCGACHNKCPAGAIAMAEDGEGFLAPVIDDGKCTQCGLCAKACPALHFEFTNAETPDCYAVMAKDEVRWVSSSGGMFTLAADYVLERGGRVCGAAFSEDFRSVRHAIIDHWEKLSPLRGSKYAQSDTNTVFSEIKTLLETTEAPVLFCGCPCQVAGLYNYLEDDYENLITIDLICHSIGSPKAHRSYLEEMTFSGTKPIINFYHKTKDKGWGAVIKIEYENGEVYYEDEKGSFYKAYLSDLNTRRSCHICPYTAMKRVGDISIGDFWGVKKINPQYTDNKGTSLVLINSEKGNAVFQMTKERMILCEKCDEKGIAIAKNNNRPLSHPTPNLEMRKIFFNHLGKNKFSTALAYGQRQARQDVGLVGWWNGTNFGSTLTSYALYREIITLGFSPVFVTSPVETKNNPPHPNLTDFSRKHFKASVQRFPFEMPELNNHCDMFLVGSDQLWNWDVFTKKDYFFLLNFVDDRRKKISYATSFAHSHSKFPEFELPKARHLMQRFDCISVREDDGVKICSEIFGVEAAHVLDPVFICEKNEYLKLANDAKIKSTSGFVFAYILDPTDEKVELLKYIAKKLDKRIITFSDPQRLSTFDPSLLKDCGYIENATIEDWVYHIINCDFAFVDSFHGTCFSLIFEKNFVSLANPFRGVSRFTSLGKQFGIEDRIFYDAQKVINNDVILAPIDYEPINAKLNTMKEMSRIWLHNALNSPKDDSTLSSSDLLYRDFGSLQARLSNVEKNLDDVKKAQKLMRDASLKMPEDQNETARADVNLIDSGEKIHRFNAILGSCGGTIFDYFTAKGINEVALYSNNPSLALIWEQAYHLDIKITHIISDSLNEITLKYPREGKLPTVKPDGSDVNVPVIILSEGVKAPNSFKQHYNATDLFLFAYFKRTLFDYLVDFNEKHSEIPLLIVNHPQISSISNPSEIEREILKINPDYEKINKAVFYDSGKTKEYRNQVMRLFDSVQRDGTLVFRDMDDETRKVVNGKLVTSDVPDNADRIIYFFGNSYCAGLGADYAHTVCSALQRKLNSCGLNPPEFAVCNTVNSCGLNPLEMRKSFQKEYIYSGDVAVFYAIFNGLCHEVYGSRFSWVETQSEFDRPHEHGELFVDKDNHLNERGYDLVAENLHRSLNGNGILSHAAKLERKAIVQNNATIRLDGNLEKLLGDYLAGLYQYKTAGKIGSIVMNCNPFTLGHRYLVEYAASKVDSLIIFVVEEDKSIFPFADRFELVKKGTSDLSNVTVIPSGKFIISQMTFKSYFIKDEVKNSVIDPSGDVEIFAQRIAPALGITVRFAGEEPLDNVTRQYNSAMRRILPHYGIAFEVIPRKQFGDSVISASRVRAMLKTKDFGGIAKIVPETTLEYLKNKILQGVRI